MAHPGKKLLFMGSEFAHFIEWKYDDQLDWFLLMYDRHPQVRQYVKTLNHLYSSTPAFYELERTWDGFQWITPNDTDNSVLAFLRTDARGNVVLCVVNFTPVFHPIYRIGLPMEGTLTELLNSDRVEYGGSNQYNAFTIRTQSGEMNGFPWHVFLFAIGINIRFIVKGGKETAIDRCQVDGRSCKHPNSSQLRAFRIQLLLCAQEQWQ